MPSPELESDDRLPAGLIHVELDRARWWRPWRVLTVRADRGGHTFTVREQVLTRNTGTATGRLVEAARLWILLDRNDSPTPRPPGGAYGA